MSEKTEKTETTDVEKKTDAGFSIKLVDNIENEDDKQTIRKILEQNAEMLKQNQEMKDIITKQETERELAKFEKQRELSLNTLKELHPALATKHKDTRDLGTLQTAIETAQAFKSNFPEFEEAKAKDKASGAKQYIVPTNYRK